MSDRWLFVHVGGAFVCQCVSGLSFSHTTLLMREEQRQLWAYVCVCMCVRACVCVCPMFAISHISGQGLASNELPKPSFFFWGPPAQTLHLTMDVHSMSQYELIKHAASLGLPTRSKNKDGKRCRLREKVLRVGCLEKNERGQVTMTRYMNKQVVPVVDSVPVFFMMRKMELMSYAMWLGVPTRRIGKKGKSNIWRHVEDVRRDVARELSALDKENSLSTHSGLA